MKKHRILSSYLLAVLFLFFAGCQSPETAREPAYKPSWESVKAHQTPDWFRDAKFGIYFHWGPYSVPAYKTEWYSHYMYVKGHPINTYHVENYGPLSEFGYKDFIPAFTASKFDAEKWVELFEKAGAQFTGPVAEHADGFAMWDSKLTEWDAMDMGPKRDIVGEIARAVRKTDMKFITTFHHQWLYAWYPTMDESTDASNPEYRDLYGPPVPVSYFQGVWDDSLARNYGILADTALRPGQEFQERWISRLKEVIDNYQPDLIYFDNKLHIIDEAIRLDFLQYYYNKGKEWGRDVVCTYKFHDLEKGAGVLDLERARMSETKEFPWLTDDSVDWSSWCNVKDPDYKSTNRIIDFLVDVVSKNGCVLLNITPTADGEIPQPVQDRLLEIGDWFNINGEAIYGTRPWKVFGEGPMEVVEGHLSERQNPESTSRDIRFTSKEGVLYAIALDWPDETLKITSLGCKGHLIDDCNVKDIELLGSDEEISWELKEEALVVQMPEQKPCEHAFALKITLD